MHETRQATGYGIDDTIGLEHIEGRHVARIAAAELRRRLDSYAAVELDLGTGDGRYVRTMAQRHPERFFIGIDACRENLREASRLAPPNALYLIANALALPPALDGLATRLTLNFPWGSLLGGLLDEDSGLPTRLAQLVRAEAAVCIRLNAGALEEAGYELDEGARRVRWMLRRADFTVLHMQMLGPRELRAIPTTWAHRLAFGRDPRALQLTARLLAAQTDQRK